MTLWGIIYLTILFTFSPLWIGLVAYLWDRIDEALFGKHHP